MYGRKKNIYFLGILFTILLTFPVYGKTSEVIENEYTMQLSEIGFATESDADQSAQSIQAPRGMLIGVGYVQLSNESRGVLGVYAETLCGTYVDEILMRIYLDVLDSETDEEEDSWHTVDYYQYDWTKEDARNEELYAVSVSFDIYGLERGRYYRIRCSHYAYSGESMEARSSQTGFISLN